MNIKLSPKKFTFLVVLTALLSAGTLYGRRGDESRDAVHDKSRDYRSRTIYVALTDRFHPHDPYQPYVDPQYPNATNSVNCFTGNCDTEVEYRSFWGGDILGFIQKLDYLKDMEIGAVWLTPMYKG